MYIVLQLQVIISITFVGKILNLVKTYSFTLHCYTRKTPLPAQKVVNQFTYTVVSVWVEKILLLVAPLPSL